MENILFRPEEKIVMECEYFQVKNDIFDLHFTIKSLRAYKKAGKLIKDKMILEYRELDSYEKLTYIYLCRCANNKDNAFPSYTNIAAKVGCSRSKAIECIKVLNQNGFIYKENRFNEKGENTSNLYYINTKLEILKDKLDNLYPTQQQEIINKDSIPGKLPSIPGKLGGSIPGKLPSIPGKPKKEQLKNNNIKKEQSNNNKIINKKKDIIKTITKKKDNSVVVTKEDFNKLKAMLYIMLDTKLIDKDIENIAIALKQQYNSIDKERVESICNIIKSSSSEINNVIGYFLAAIKNKYTNTNYKNNNNITNNNLKFNNFDQRNYDYDKLEKELLGWDK